MAILTIWFHTFHLIHLYVGWKFHDNYSTYHLTIFLYLTYMMRLCITRWHINHPKVETWGDATSVTTTEATKDFGGEPSNNRKLWKRKKKTEKKPPTAETKENYDGELLFYRETITRGLRMLVLMWWLLMETLRKNQEMWRRRIADLRIKAILRDPISY